MNRISSMLKFLLDRIDTVDTKMDDIGTIYSNVTNKAIAVNPPSIDTYVVGASVSLPAGTYIIEGYWTFPPGGGGARNIDVDLSTSSGPTATGALARQRIVSGDANWARLNVTRIVKFNSATTVYVKGSANKPVDSGENQIRAIRIK